MGWIILIIIIILIASSDSKTGKTNSTNNTKGKQIDQYIKSQIDSFVSLRNTRPSTPGIDSQIGKVVDNLIDEYLYCNQRPEYSKECTAIIRAFCEHSMRYIGTKYPQFRGRALDDIIYELIHDPRYNPHL